MGSCGGMAVTRGLPCILLMLACCWLCEAGAGLAALYVLGDSQADAGTNNHLATVLRADHPHNGVDYLECKATGRFSNGKNFVDFLAEHLKLPSSPPPYLSICNTPSNNSIYLSGVNFASGGAGVLNQTNQGECIIFDYQIDHHFSKVHASLVQQLGQAQASAHLSRSIFAVAIGGNDILNYVRPSLVNQVLSPCPPPTQSRDEFVDSLVLSLKDQLQRLYKLGMRRMFIIGAPPLGCCPVLRGKVECDAGANYMSSQYNIKVASLVRDMSDKYPDMLYSLFDPSIKLLDYFQRPGANGYAVVDTACCGLGGEKNAMFSCTLASSLCKNRTNHVFWDFVHPTEITAQKLTEVAFHGLAPSVTPINVRQLCDTAM